MYTLPYVKWITGGNLLYATGNPRFWDNLEGWDGEGGGGDLLWLIHVGVWQKPSQYHNYPPIKNKIFKNDKKSKVILLIMLGNVCAAPQVQEYLTSRNRIDILYFY